MKQYMQIRNHGQICEVMGTNATGGVMLRNPNGNRALTFHKNAIEPAPHGQYVFCAFCHAPMMLSPTHPYCCPYCQERAA